VEDLCAELGVTRQTLHRHVAPDGSLRADGQRLQKRFRDQFSRENEGNGLLKDTGYEGGTDAPALLGGFA
jgi:hypothetical protein